MNAFGRSSEDSDKRVLLRVPVSSCRLANRVLWRGLLLATLLCAVPSPTASAADFVFIGRGNGHGIGMSQYGARGMALVGRTYEQIVRHYYGSAGTDPKCVVSVPGSEPYRDINLDPRADYSSSGNAGYTRSRWSIRPGHKGSALAVYAGGTVYLTSAQWSYFSASGDKVVWKTSDGTINRTFSGTIAVWGASGSPRLTQVLEGTGVYSEGYIRYRGELRLSARNGLLKLVNRVSMRDYLYGVVPREMPSSWPMEALKSQAVAARSYAWTSTRSELYTDVRDQAYAGHSSGYDRDRPDMHEAESTNRAVDETAGRCVTYDGKIVRTYYMSTSGGHTENVENVWFAASPAPTLRGVPDEFEHLAGSPWHGWTRVTLSGDELRSRLIAAGEPASLVPTAVASVRVAGRGVSGRVTSVTIKCQDGTTVVLDTVTELGRFQRALGYRDKLIFINPRTTRIAGSDRFATSVAASQRVFGQVVSPTHVVLVNGRSLVDALPAAALAGATGGCPILLCEQDSVPDVVMSEIQRLKVRHVYVVGGTGVVSPNVEQSLKDAGFSVSRLGGVDRYATARLVAAEVKRLDPAADGVVVINGAAFADGVIAGPVSYVKRWPVIFVGRDVVPTETAEALRAVAPSRALIVGGSSVVGTAVAEALPSPQRVGGATRYETADAMRVYAVKELGFNVGSLYLASGESAADALALAPVAGYNKNPVLLSRLYDLTAPTAAALDSLVITLNRVHIAGGDGAISGWLEGQVLRKFESVGR